MSSLKNPVIKVDKEPAFPIGNRVMKVANQPDYITVSTGRLNLLHGIPIGSKGNIIASNKDYIRVKWDGHPDCHIETHKLECRCNCYFYPYALACIIPVEE